MRTIANLRKRYEERLLRGASCDFERNLLIAAFENLESAGPLTFNNFSYALREFLRHILHSRSPDDEVKSCGWFKPDETSANGITRLHRAKFAIQGGLSDTFVEKKLQIDTSDTLKGLVSAQNTLSKYTHIGPETFALSRQDTYDLAEECLDALVLAVDQIGECRSEVLRALRNAIDQHLIDKIVSDGIYELEEIATHGWTDGFSIDDVCVEQITAKKVLLSVYGEVEVGLQYGSNSDVENDIGYITSDSYPFKASISVRMERPLGKHAEVSSFIVDISSFYD